MTIKQKVNIAVICCQRNSEKNINIAKKKLGDLQVKQTVICNYEKTSSSCSFEVRLEELRIEGGRLLIDVMKEIKANLGDVFDISWHFVLPSIKFVCYSDADAEAEFKLWLVKRGHDSTNSHLYGFKTCGTLPGPKYSSDITLPVLVLSNDMIRTASTKSLLTEWVNHSGVLKLYVKHDLFNQPEIPNFKSLDDNIRDLYDLKQVIGRHIAKAFGNYPANYYDKIILDVNLPNTLLEKEATFSPFSAPGSVWTFRDYNTNDIYSHELADKISREDMQRVISEIFNRQLSDMEDFRPDFEFGVRVSFYDVGLVSGKRTTIPEKDLPQPEPIKAPAEVINVMYANDINLLNHVHHLYRNALKIYVTKTDEVYKESLAATNTLALMVAPYIKWVYDTLPKEGLRVVIIPDSPENILVEVFNKAYGYLNLTFIQTTIYKTYLDTLVKRGYVIHAIVDETVPMMQPPFGAMNLGQVQNGIVPPRFSGFNK